MKNLILPLLTICFLIIAPDLSFSQDKAPQPFILAFMPEGLLARCDYSQLSTVSVPITGTLAKDPTEKAIANLKELIIETCKLNKMDGFVLNQIIFAKPFNEGVLIAYGTMLRVKPVPEAPAK